MGEPCEHDDEALAFRAPVTSTLPPRPLLAVAAKSVVVVVAEKSAVAAKSVVVVVAEKSADWKRGHWGPSSGNLATRADDCPSFAKCGNSGRRSALYPKFTIISAIKQVLSVID